MNDLSFKRAQRLILANLDGSLIATLTDAARKYRAELIATPAIAMALSVVVPIHHVSEPSEMLRVRHAEVEVVAAKNAMYENIADRDFISAQLQIAAPGSPQVAAMQEEMGSLAKGSLVAAKALADAVDRCADAANDFERAAAVKPDLKARLPEVEEIFESKCNMEVADVLVPRPRG